MQLWLIYVQFLVPRCPGSCPLWGGATTVKIDSELEYKLCEILDSKYNLHCWSTCELFYYIQWMGYKGTNEEYQWTATMNLTHTDKLIEEFHQRYPTKPSPDLFTPDHDDCVACQQKAIKQHKALREQA